MEFVYQKLMQMMQTAVDYFQKSQEDKALVQLQMVINAANQALSKNKNQADSFIDNVQKCKQMAQDKINEKTQQKPVKPTSTPIKQQKQNEDKQLKQNAAKQQGKQEIKPVNHVQPDNKYKSPTAPHYQQAQANLHSPNMQKNGVQKQNTQQNNNLPKSEFNEITFVPQNEPTLNTLTLSTALKNSFENALINPCLRPDLFTGNRRPPQRILLFGPSGTGKTAVTRAAANQSKLYIITASASTIMNKYVGESEKALKALFQYAQQFKCILFFDEIDSLCTSRTDSDSESGRRVKTEFLQLTDGIQAENKSGLVLIAATNRPQDLDDAVRRRFDERIYVGLPEERERYECIKKLVSSDQNDLSDKDLHEIARLTERFSFSDLKQLAQKAALNVLKGKDIVNMHTIKNVGMQEYQEALKEVRPSNTEKQVLAMKQWLQQQ